MSGGAPLIPRTPLTLHNLTGPQLQAAETRARREGWPSLDYAVSFLVVRYSELRDAGGGGLRRAKRLSDTQRQASARHAATEKWKDVPAADRRAHMAALNQRRWATSRARAATTAHLAGLLTGARFVPCWPLEEGGGDG